MSQETTQQKSGRSPGRRLLRGLFITAVVLVLLVGLLLGSLTAVLGTERGSRWVLDMATDMVASEDLQLAYGAMSGSLARGLTLHDFSVQMGNNRIEAREFRSLWNPFTVLTGEFILDHLAVEGLLVDWPGNEPAAEPAEPVPLRDTLDNVLPLPISIRLAEVSLDDAEIRSGDTELEIEHLSLAALLRDRDLRVSSLVFRADPIALEGNIDVALLGDLALDGDLNWQLYGMLPEDMGEETSGRLQFHGDLNRLQLSHALQAPLQLQSDGHFHLGLADTLNLTADALDMGIDLQHEMPMQSLPLAALEDWEIGQTQITTRGWLEDLEISGNSHLRSIDVEALDLDAALSWQAALQGDQLLISEALVETASGQIRSSGLVGWADVPHIRLDIDLEDNAPLSTITAAPEALDLSDLVAALSLDLRFTEDGPQGEVQMRSLNAILNDFPLDAVADVVLDQQGIHVRELELQTASNEVRLNGSLQDETLDMQLALSAPSLEELYPELTGSLELDAVINGRLDDPSIRIEGNARALRFNDIMLADLRIDGSTRSGENEIRLELQQLEVAGETVGRIDLRLDGQLQEHLLRVDVDSDLLQLGLSLQGGLEDAQWIGRLLDSRFSSPEYDTGAWQQTEAADLQLSANNNSLSSLCWQQGTASLCLDAALDEAQQVTASLSLDGYPLTALNSAEAAGVFRNFHESDRDYPTPGDAHNLPFSLPENLALLGEVGLQATASGAINDLNALQADFNLRLNGLELYVLAAEGEILNGDEETDPLVEQFLWEQTEVTGEFSEGHLRVNSLMDFYQQSLSGTEVAMRGTTRAELEMDPEQALTGRVDLDFDDIAWLEALVPQISELHGEFHAALLLGGTVSNPEFGADVSLLDAGLRVAPLGLELRAVNMNLVNDDNGNFQIEASAESGQGRVELESDILRPFAEDREFSLALRGNDFMLADIEEVTLAISPDLRVQGSLSGIHATGTLRVPLLDARVTTLPETATNVSGDTILVSQREDRPPVRNAAQVDQGPLNAVPLSAEVRVILGDDVRIAAFGLNARLGGMLDINQRADSSPLMYGELDVAEGTFETYGTELNIERGQLLFFGPFDNPAIDIRAVRTVENMRVGVQMGGTIRNMRSSLFSNPTLPDGDVLAVLITGRPLAEIGQSDPDSNAMVGAITSLGLSQSEGLVDQVRSTVGLDTLAIDSSGDLNDSSLTLGKYITPRIFIKYAVGLFETENVLAIDYRITDSIKLEAQSGQYQSLDLTYTIER